MSLKEQVYSVLIVSASEKINQALSELFTCPLYAPVQFVPHISAAKRALAEREFDFVIVNAPAADDMGIRFAVDTVDASPSVVLFLIKAEQYGDAYDLLAQHGVFLLQKPIAKSMLSAAAEWLISARERIRKTEKKTLSIEEKMNEIRLVNRAKWLLISELNMTEAEAHRLIEKQAMDHCISKRRAAEEIIRLYG
ncbi:MAG: ANTAR domain-containing protein [Clostridia bacterium]|nr:ANTAR domain-containing protein [Clostridia bacterium]